MTTERIAPTSEVSAAMEAGRPIVALESTVIAQGLPWPENLETARRAEAVIRAAGAIPATLAVLGGTIRIGLTDSELVSLARITGMNDHDDGSELTEKGRGSVRYRFGKANRRDLAAVIARGDDAATTVSASLWVARRFGLVPGVMATGGLGGVHRQATTSFDISTDLDELARADGAVVVCSGLKSILDLPATLETLETRGVLVVGYRIDELPGFLTRSSGLPLEHRVDSPEEAAALIRAHRALRLPGAIVLAQPVPEAEALDQDLMRTALEAALDEAESRRIRGKPLTPFLLDSIRQATHGRSLRANCALLIANARLAGEIAAALSVRAGTAD